MTLLGGLVLMTDNPDDPTYDSNFMGITLVMVNSLGFIALLLGLLVLHPAIRRRLNQKPGKGSKREGSKSKVVPVANASGHTGTGTGTDNQGTRHPEEGGPEKNGPEKNGPEKDRLKAQNSAPSLFRI